MGTNMQNIDIVKEFKDLAFHYEELRKECVEQANVINKLKSELDSKVHIDKNIEGLFQNVSLLMDLANKKFGNEKYVSYVNIKDKIFAFQDLLISNTVKIVAEEINSTSQFDNINFKKGDIVVDIGGNIGMVSIFLAKTYPFLKIYAFEPVRENYENFLENIKLNNIPEGTITVENKAVTKDGRKVSMCINENNSGGSAVSDIQTDKAGYVYRPTSMDIESITLDEIYTKYKIKELKLLKIDCEGAEYEILGNTKESILENIKYLRGEFHNNKSSLPNGKAYTAEDLINHCRKYIQDINIIILG